MIIVSQAVKVVLRSLFLYLAFLFSVVAANHATESASLDGGAVMYAALAAVMVVAPELFSTSSTAAVATSQRRRIRRSPNPRERKKVRKIMEELGEIYTRRTYRMTEQSFWILHECLLPYVHDSEQPPPDSKKKNKNGAPNGIIPFEIRLSAALRYFAGGAIPDIALVHGISPTEVQNSIWITVDAVNKCIAFNIQFPSDHAEQRRIAEGFRAISTVGFDCCVGALDGLLIWLPKPTITQCQNVGLGGMKFMCGRKKRFGLNMQAVSDAIGRFLDVTIDTPGATSDYLSFQMSNLRDKLETPGFLAEGLCVFGDAAYVNTMFLAAPFKSVTDEQKDSYNYFHSQLRIRVECAFGMLVHRWALLRMPLSHKLTIAKATSLVYCLCKLHNFCIDQREASMQEYMPDVDENIARRHSSQPGVRLGENMLPIQSAVEGRQTAIPRDERRQQEKQIERNADLPCNRMLQHVIDSGMVRPRPVPLPVMTRT